MYSDKTIRRLEGYIRQYDMVILWKLPLTSLDVGEKFVVEKKVLFLSEETRKFDIPNVTFLELSKEEALEMINLYHTYEFSNRFKVISDSNNSFGGVFNLRHAGFLNDEEVMSIIID